MITFVKEKLISFHPVKSARFLAKSYVKFLYGRNRLLQTKQTDVYGIFHFPADGILKSSGTFFISMYK